jgi:hypothetical protein
MGRASRERRERVQAGLEKPWSDKEREKAKTALGNPIIRKIVELKSRGAAVDELSQGTVVDQIGRLDTLVGEGTLPDSRLKKALMSKAPGEMDKAINKFKKSGKEVSVDSLCAEVKSTPGFLAMCERVGLRLEWFENLARERMEANGL